MRRPTYHAKLLIVFAICVLLLPFTVFSKDFSSYAIIGDTKIGTTESVYKQFLDIISKKGIHTIFLVGDVIDRPGNEKEWGRFLELTSNNYDFYIAPGNHDINSAKSLKIYGNLIRKPVYHSLSTEDTNFIVLSTETPGETSRITGKQLEWLREELRKNSLYKIVFLHKPLFPTAFGKGYCLDRHMVDRDALHDLFVKSGVNVVFAGHEHLYNRIEKDGIIYVTTGGGGSRLLTFDEEYGGFFHYTIAKRENGGYIFTVYDMNEYPKDKFSIKKEVK
ncbi:MAG: metallophosphoesterase [Proteobacteria bacterium]|nr:metallophosphoesterase [Pseudomonadota bacterium]